MHTPFGTKGVAALHLHPLPFKGRAGVGMGCSSPNNKPTPTQTLPLKGRACSIARSVLPLFGRHSGALAGFIGAGTRNLALVLGQRIESMDSGLRPR